MITCSRSSLDKDAIALAIAQNDPELDQQLAESEAGQPESPSIEQFRDWY